MKKFLGISIFAVILFGCICGAGCIATNPADSITTPHTITQDDDEADIWINIENKKRGVQAIYFYENKTGKKVKYDIYGNPETRTFTWEQAGPYYTVIFDNDVDVDTFTHTDERIIHDAHKYTLMQEKLPKNTTPEPEQDSIVCGSWTYTDGITTKLIVLENDGAGYKIENADISTKKPFTWKKTGSKYYTLFYINGEDDSFSFANEIIDKDGDIYTKNEITTPPF